MPVLATKALVKAAESGDPLNLPACLGTVQSRGGVFRRGHLVLIGGIPNSGKSAFAEWLAEEVKAPAIYFSADQDPWTTTTRLASIITGDDKDTVGGAFSSGNGAYYAGALSKSRISFCFDSNPTLADLGLELDAYVETWDEYPEVIVVDTLRNISDSDSDKAGDLFIMKELHGLARRTKACVVVLAHLSMSGLKEGEAVRPRARSTLINKIDEMPDMILTVAYDPDDLSFWIAVVKTREGKSDPDAKHPIKISANFDNMQFGVLATGPSWGQER